MKLLRYAMVAAAMATVAGCGGAGESASVADMQAVKFEDPGGQPSEDWARAMKAWVDSGDASRCGIGSAHDFAKGPRAEEFGAGLTVLSIEQDGARGTCEAAVQGEADKRAFLVSVELFPDAEAALAKWDDSVGGANDEGRALVTYRRTDIHPFLDGTSWVFCWNDFDRPDEARNCDFAWFYQGVLLTGELGSDLDPDPTPQQAADWLAAVLPNLVRSS